MSEKINIAFPNPPVGQSMVPPPTLANIRTLLEAYRVKLRYNQTKKRLEATFADVEISPLNSGAQILTKVMDLCVTHGISTSHLDENLNTIAMEDPFNPVAEWISEKEWDGTDRFDDFFRTLRISKGFDTDFAKLLLYKWLLSIAAAAFLLDFRSRGIFVLQGAQGLGKTSWFSNMIPGKLGKDVIKTDHDWSGGSKDARITSITHHLVEWGELESSLKRSIGKFKAFITADMDKIRRPYGRADVEYPRTTVFCASVNDAQFLADGSGNSRFWVIPVTGIHHTHDTDMQQLFAQAKTKLDAGEQWWLTREEENQLAASNATFTPSNPIMERVLEEIDIDRIGDDSARRFSASGLLRELGINNPSTAQARECGKVLREHLGEPAYSHSIAYWRVPLREDHSNYGKNGGKTPVSAVEGASIL